MASEKLDRLYLLDGMRGLAAFAVIVDHVPSPFLRTLIPGRYLAVDFFFALSGLVLARAYAGSLTDGRGIARFLKLRLIRLYPMYLLGLLLGALAALYPVLRGWQAPDAPFHVTNLLAGAFFLPSPATQGEAFDPLFPYDPPAWSLFFELVANTVWALLAARLTRRLLPVLLVGLAVWAAPVVLHGYEPGLGWAWSDFEIGLARAMFSFFMGVALYRVLSSTTLPRLPFLLPVALLVGILCCPMPISIRTAYDVAVMLVIVPVTILLAARAQLPSMMRPVCTWLGAISYGVYVLHVPVFNFIEPKLQAWGVPGMGQVVATGVIAALLAQLAISVYETPLRRRLLAAFLPARPADERN